jgi:hypothetical protein
MSPFFAWMLNLKKKIPLIIMNEYIISLENYYSKRFYFVSVNYLNFDDCIFPGFLSHSFARSYQLWKNLTTGWQQWSSTGISYACQAAKLKTDILV